MFITFEGGEGSGKSTQTRFLAEFLTKNSYKNILTREPGGTKNAEDIRKMLVEGSANRWSPITEILLYMAARNDHVVNLIKPELAKQTIVICDRFTDSTLAYQGYGHGIDSQIINQLNDIASQGIVPDLTFILDIDPEIGISRTKKRHNNENRYENMDINYHKRVRSGFLEIAKKSKERCVLLDASEPLEEIKNKIKSIIVKKISLKQLTD